MNPAAYSFSPGSPTRTAYLMSKFAKALNTATQVKSQITAGKMYRAMFLRLMRKSFRAFAERRRANADGSAFCAACRDGSSQTRRSLSACVLGSYSKGPAPMEINELEALAHDSILLLSSFLAVASQLKG